MHYQSLLHGCALSLSSKLPAICVGIKSQCQGYWHHLLSGRWQLLGCWWEGPSGFLCKKRSHKEGAGGGKRATEGREEHCGLSEAPHPVAWRQRAQQMVHSNLSSQPGTSLPSLGSGRAWLGPVLSSLAHPEGWCSWQRPGFAKPAEHKGCKTQLLPNPSSARKGKCVVGVHAPQGTAEKPGSVWV